MSPSKALAAIIHRCRLTSQILPDLAYLRNSLQLAYCGARACRLLATAQQNKIPSHTATKRQTSRRYERRGNADARRMVFTCKRFRPHSPVHVCAPGHLFSGPSLRPTIESAPEIRFYVFRRAGRTLLPSARRAFCLAGHIAAARFERQTQSLAPHQRRPTVTRCDELRGSDPLICDDLALHLLERRSSDYTP